MRTIYDWLDEVKQRPSMYLGRLHDLEKMLFGYLAALNTHQIDEGVPHCKHFATWLQYRTGWSTSCGWGDAFHENVKPAEKAVEAFFAILHKFRQLRPEVEARVYLSERHQPTGRRIVIGYAGGVARPASIEVVRYAPEPRGACSLPRAPGRRVECGHPRQTVPPPPPNSKSSAQTPLDAGS